MNLLIHNVTIFTNDAQNQLFSDHAVAINGVRIHEIGRENELKEKYPDYQQIDGSGKLLMPGLVNTHMHFYGTFARGLALPQAPKKFSEILSMLWWKLDGALDEEAIYSSALVPAISAIKNGVTAVIDHHASPNCVTGSLDKIHNALETVGLRAVLCYEVSDRDGKEIRDAGIQENARYIEKSLASKKRDPDHLFDGMVGLHASFTLDDDTLRQASDLSRRLERGCHIHVLEDEVDREETSRKYGVGVVKRLCEFGILGERTIAAHCIYVDDSEVRHLAETDTIIAHNPQSNMNNAVGCADIFKLIQAGILVGLGTDGMSSDLGPDVRAANLLHKHDVSNSNVGWNEVQQMTLKNNPRIYERVSGQKVGRIEPGYLADLILVDYYPPTKMSSENFWGHFLYGICDAVVDTTIINGKIVMQDKVVFGIDEEKIVSEARNCAKKVWGRFAKA